jgi:hypothetical protein
VTFVSPFKIVKVKNLTLNLEEEMICKVLKFAGFTRSDDELESVDETAYDAQHALIMSTTTAKRFYFGTLKLELSQVGICILVKYGCLLFLPCSNYDKDLLGYDNIMLSC